MLRNLKLTKWETTPDHLRALAKRLEEDWKEVTIGDDVPKIVIIGHDGNELHIAIDQEEMHRQETRKKKSPEFK